MLNPIIYRLELDVMQINELQEAVELSVKNRLQAMVVHQSLTSRAILERGKRQGQFKIITPIDWPKGEIFGTLKFRGLEYDALDVDGFEIMVTPNKNTNDTHNEVSAITKFVRDHLPQDVEIRYVLGTSSMTPERIAEVAEVFKKIPAPNFIRTDHNLKLQVNKANPELHNTTVEVIRKAVGIPIKLSGNIGNVRTIMECQDAARYAVNLQQLRSIIKDLQTSSDIKNILDGTSQSS